MKSFKEECGEGRVEFKGRGKRGKKTKFPSAVARRRRAWETMRRNYNVRSCPSPLGPPLSRDMNLQVNFLRAARIISRIEKAVFEKEIIVDKNI